MLNTLKNFLDLYSKDSSSSAEKGQDSTLSMQTLKNSPLIKDIATEQFYILTKTDNGTEQRVYLNNEQLKLILG